jgi:putative FmdB family regulatory protein
MKISGRDRLCRNLPIKTAAKGAKNFMPVYEYEHEKKACALGKIFDFRQSLDDKPLSQCPHCRGPVQKIISRINISCPKTNSELRDLGFTKLVKRDDGVYENVTPRHGESRYMERGKPETIPDLSKTISD